MREGDYECFEIGVLEVEKCGGISKIRFEVMKLKIYILNS
jgi:hypothetical protein